MNILIFAQGASPGCLLRWGGGGGMTCYCCASAEKVAGEGGGGGYSDTLFSDFKFFSPKNYDGGRDIIIIMDMTDR